MKFTAQMIADIAAKKVPLGEPLAATPQEIADGLNAALEDAGVELTRRQLVAFLGCMFMESWYFQTTTEIQWPNSELLIDRDYYPHIGRGWIQLTGRQNYLDFGRWMMKIGAVGNDYYFVDNPAALSDPEYAGYASVYYFTQVVIYDARGVQMTTAQWVEFDSDDCFAVSCCVNLGISPYTAEDLGRTPTDYPLRREAHELAQEVVPNDGLTDVPVQPIPDPQPEPAPEPEPWTPVPAPSLPPVYEPYPRQPKTKGKGRLKKLARFFR